MTEANRLASVRFDAIRGVQWTTISAAANGILYFVQTMILARILSPSDFGLMAILLVVVRFAQLFSDIGISNAIIHRQDVNDDILSSLFWLNVFSGLCVYFFFNLASPLIAILFHTPQLDHLLRYLSFVFLIIPLGQQCVAIQEKNLNFAVIARASVASYLANFCISVSAAVMGYGVLSLIWGYLGAAIIRVSLLTMQTFRKQPPKLHFDRKDLHGFLGFGLYQMLAQGLNYANMNISQALIGMLLGPKELGYYTLASELALRPVQVITPLVGRVLFPVLAKLQSDMVLMRRTFFRVHRMICMVNFPLAGGIAIAAPLAIPFLYGEQWYPSIIVAQILALFALFRSAASPIGPLLLAKGRADFNMLLNSSRMVLQLPFIYWAILYKGIYGAAAALLISQIFLMILIYRILLARLVGPCLKDIFFSFLRPMGFTFIMASSMWFATTAMSRFSTISRLITEIICGAVVYLAMLIVSKDQFLRELKQMLR